MEWLRYIERVGEVVEVGHEEEKCRHLDVFVKRDDRDAGSERSRQPSGSPRYDPAAGRAFAAATEGVRTGKDGDQHRLQQRQQGAVRLISVHIALRAEWGGGVGGVSARERSDPWRAEHNVTHLMMNSREILFSPQPNRMIRILHAAEMMRE